MNDLNRNLLATVATQNTDYSDVLKELEAAKDSADDDSLARWENENGNPDDFKEFFYDCFARLAGHYPAPDVSSDYDKSVIFAAIEKGEELDANGGAA